MITLNEKAFDYATERIEDFALVQQGRSWNERLESVNVMLDSLGLDDALKETFNEWHESFAGHPPTGEIMLGLLVGLFINQYNQEETG